MRVGRFRCWLGFHVQVSHPTKIAVKCGGRDTSATAMAPKEISSKWSGPCSASDGGGHLADDELRSFRRDWSQEAGDGSPFTSLGLAAITDSLRAY